MESSSKQLIYNPEPEADAPAPPEKTEYSCDCLVIGGGFAGLMAATTAADLGSDVILVDKGMPGFSGLTPFVSDLRWFDEELGDDMELLCEYNTRASQYMGNQNWYKAWCQNSKSVVEKYFEFGICEQYPDAKTSGHFDSNDYRGYCKYIGKRDRHAAFMRVLKEHKVRVVPHTMIYDIAVAQNTACGAVGFHVPSNTPVVFHSKSVIMCMGGGVYKSAGWPTGGISFDGISIGYRHGLNIIGQEFEDFHKTRADAPSNAAKIQGYTFLQNIFFTGADVSADDMPTAGSSRTNLYALGVKSALEGMPRWNENMPIFHRFKENASENPNDIRSRKDPDAKDLPPRITGNCGGAAPGFCMHTTNGIYCGDSDTVGFTGIKGLYCAGEGCNAGPVGGSTYAGRIGFTSCFAGVQGMLSGQAAAAYSNECTPASTDFSDLIEEMQHPLNVDKGYSADWALDCLLGIMSPMWTITLKNEACLNAALTQVEFMRDHVISKLQANDGHSLRTCIEVKNKVLEAEMKLRLSLARKESRGGHYRMDYPCRDDKNFLCYIAASKNPDGSMDVTKIDYPDSWKGDLSETYEQRYGGGVYFPGEVEEAIKKGLIVKEGEK